MDKTQRASTTTHEFRTYFVASRQTTSAIRLPTKHFPKMSIIPNTYKLHHSNRFRHNVGTATNIDKRFCRRIRIKNLRSKTSCF